MDRTQEGKRIRVGDRVEGVGISWTPATSGTVIGTEQLYLFWIRWDTPSEVLGEDDPMYSFELRHSRRI